MYLPLLVQSTLKMFAHFKVEATVKACGEGGTKAVGLRMVWLPFLTLQRTQAVTIFSHIAPTSRARDNVV